MISPAAVAEGNSSGQVLGSAALCGSLVSLLKTAESSLPSGSWDLSRVFILF